MFGYSKGPSNSLGPRRLGGPFQFKTLWPALREELLEVYIADESAGLVGEATVCEAENASGIRERACMGGRGRDGSEQLGNGAVNRYLPGPARHVQDMAGDLQGQ